MEVRSQKSGVRMATGGGRIERAVTSAGAKKGPKEPDSWRAADVGNRGLDWESGVSTATGGAGLNGGVTSAAAIRRLSARHLGNWWGRLQPAADFSPPAAGFTSFAGRRPEAG